MTGSMTAPNPEALEANHDLVTRFVDTVNAQDYDAIDGLVHADFLDHDPIPVKRGDGFADGVGARPGPGGKRRLPEIICGPGTLCSGFAMEIFATSARNCGFCRSDETRRT